MNNVFLLGKICDIKLNAVSQNSMVLKLRVATTSMYYDASGAQKKATEWHNVSYWGKNAEALSRTLFIEGTVIVEGSLTTRSYDKNGIKTYATEVRARTIAPYPDSADSASDPREPQRVPPVEDKVPF